MTDNKEKTPEVAIIVALGSDRAIGRGGDLIWRLPGDLPRFKRLTTGHTVIMGRRTWLSLPRRPLPGRRNIVVSRDPQFSPEGAMRAASPEEALRACAGEELIFIIGGGQLYDATLPLASRLYLTEVDAPCPDADTHFPAFCRDDWALTAQSEDMDAEEEGVRFRFTDLRRR